MASVICASDSFKMPFGERASLKSAFVAAAVLRSSDCADNMQETQDRKGEAARFGPRAARLSPGMTSDRIRIALSTLATDMGVTELVTIFYLRAKLVAG